MQTNVRILFVGCGKMGGALLGGMLNCDVKPEDIMIIDPSNIPINKDVRVLSAFDQEKIIEFSPDIIILAVKPQIIETILPDYKIFAENSLFVSIIAGKTIGFFEQTLGNRAAIIRTMPNLPVTIGSGVIIWAKNNEASDIQVQNFEKLFASSGMLSPIKDESLLDAVTAISGSGPAYVFYFMEILVEAALKLGLSDDLAKDLAIQTVIGSAKLAQDSDEDLITLRKNVTSPGGTTEAALKILMSEDRLKQLVVDAAAGACSRARELSD